MTNVDWIQLFRRIPEAEHGKLAIVLNTGAEVYVDAPFRYEDAFLVLRGRLAGSTDESRGFVIPYSQILCLRIERVVKVEELQEIFPTDPNWPGARAGRWKSAD